MSRFLDALRQGLSACGLDGRRVLVAVSGGADSVALLCGLVELQTECSLELRAAHLDHDLRGEDSAADAAWVESLCGRLSVNCVLERQDVKALQIESKHTLEEAARKARYDFLERTALMQNCTHIALAHTADDQAETILHHILRGTGLAGLRGIPRERQIISDLRLVRPLLEVRRTEIETWLKERGQDYRHDASNLDPSFTRNRIRHQLLPLLQTDFNPQVIPALLRLGQQAGDMEEALDHFAEIQLKAALIEQSPHHAKLRCEALAAFPLAFRRVCFTTLWRMQNWPRQRMTFAHWNSLAELLTQKRGAISLPAHLTATRRRDWLKVVWEPE
jgi:tRNA(Ile)-lysidine synthase